MPGFHTCGSHQGIIPNENSKKKEGRWLDSSMEEDLNRSFIPNFADHYNATMAIDIQCQWDYNAKTVIDSLPWSLWTPQWQCRGRGNRYFLTLLLVGSTAIIMEEEWRCRLLWPNRISNANSQPLWLHYCIWGVCSYCSIMQTKRMLRINTGWPQVMTFCFHCSPTTICRCINHALCDVALML